MKDLNCEATPWILGDAAIVGSAEAFKFGGVWAPQCRVASGVAIECRLEVTVFGLHFLFPIARDPYSARTLTPP